MYRELFWYAEFAARLVQECAILVPGWELKWSTPNRPLHPTPDKFDFTVAD
jgi:endo-1,4-beta-xylanase